MRGVRPGAPVLSARQRTSPTLDGWLDDWVSEHLTLFHVAFGQEYWSGPADLSGRGYVSWDSRMLLIAVAVTDDQFSQPASGADLFLGDSIEVQLDTDLLGDWDLPTYDVDDWQIGLSPGDFGANPPEAVVWRPAGKDAGTIVVNGQRIPEGYTVEAAIPWDLLGLDPVAAGRIGLALNISDNDFSEPAQVTMVSSVPARSWSDPRSFGTVLLLPSP